MTRVRLDRALVAAVIVLVTAALASYAGTPGSGVSGLARILERGGKWTESDVAEVRRLLRTGESIRTRGPRGVTVLMFGARAGGAAMMRAALRGGVDVNARTQNDLTALWFAMSSRDEERVRVLLDAGADVDPRDSYGRTPLMMATSFKFRRGIELLLARGADINARNNSGHTALAYTDSHRGITALLRRHGALE